VNDDELASVEMMYLCVILCLSVVTCTSSHATVNSSLPLVLWHGMGDSCCAEGSVSPIMQLIQSHLPSIHMHSIMIGDDETQDFYNSYFTNVNTQISMACKMISEDEKLKNGYNAMGFSQGGQFLRGLAQRCPSPPMVNLISIGGQHEGVFGLPHCTGGEVCEIVRKLLDYGAYTIWIE